MQIGLSGRAFVHFLIFELVLVGLLAMIGQVPWWLWFVLSALLFAALWTYDHRGQLYAWLQRLEPKHIAWLGSTAAVLAVALAVGVTWSLISRQQQVTLPPPTTTPPVTLERSLLTVAAITTAQTHDPLRVTFSVANAGKLPTTRVVMKIDHAVVDAPQPATLVPGQPPIHFNLHSPRVTKDVLEEVRAGKKAVYVLFAAAYRDSATPTDKWMITEVAVRTSPFTHKIIPLQDWSLLRNRSYLSD